MCMSILLSTFTVSGYAISVDDSDIERNARIKYSHEFTLDLGDANFQYFIFTPDNSLGSCTVYFSFTDMSPKISGAKVQVLWENKLTHETDFKPMGYGDIVEYGQQTYFQMPLSMIRNYRLKVINLGYPEQRFYGTFLLTYEMI